MDALEISKTAGVAGRYATDIVVAKIRMGQEINPEAWERAADSIYAWMAAKAGGAPFVPPQQQQPVDPMQIPPPPPQYQQPPPFPPQGVTTAPQPAPQSQPVAPPSQPQPVMAGPPCPNCQTPMAMTKDFAAKKARNLSEGKKAPPLWRCPMGSWTPQQGAQGCQGCQFEEQVSA